MVILSGPGLFHLLFTIHHLPFLFTDCIEGFISFIPSQNSKIQKILSQVTWVKELGNFIVEFVAYYFSQSGQLLESMILPPWIGNREINEFQQSCEGVLEAILVSALFPAQRPLILAADISKLRGK